MRNSNLKLNIGVNKNIILKNNVNGYAYIEDKDIHRDSTVVANSQGSADNTQVHSVIVAGEGLAVVWFSSFNENDYGVNYRVFN